MEGELYLQTPSSLLGIQNCMDRYKTVCTVKKTNKDDKIEKSKTYKYNM